MMKPKRILDDRGAVAVTFAAALFLFGAFGVVAVDISSWYAERREAQADADAIALAGAIELPDMENDAQAVADAQAAALAWAAANGVPASDVTIDVIDTCFSSNDEVHTGVQATVHRDADTFLLPFLSSLAPTVTTTAVACSGTPHDMFGMLPFALQTNSDCFTPHADPDQRDPIYGQRCDIQVSNNGSDIGQLSYSTDDPNDSCTANSNSASEYEENIVNGSIVTCSIGDSVQSNTGVNVGPTKSGLEARLAMEGPCTNNPNRSFPDVQADTSNFNMHPTIEGLFPPTMGNDGGTVDDFFEVWQPGLNYDVNTPAEDLQTIDCDAGTEGVQTSPRNVVVIVVNDINVDDGTGCGGTNSHCYMVRGFVRMYLEGCSTANQGFSAKCDQSGGGNTFTIHARFVEALGHTNGNLGLSRFGDVQTYLKH